MLRVNRLAAAIDMIAAGTRAPIPIAAKATPTNQDGKLWRNRAGTAKLLPNSRGQCLWSVRTMPAPTDAGLLFIGRIHTPWTSRMETRGRDGPLCRIEVFEPWVAALA